MRRQRPTPGRGWSGLRIAIRGLLVLLCLEMGMAWWSTVLATGDDGAGNRGTWATAEHAGGRCAGGHWGVGQAAVGRRNQGKRRQVRQTRQTKRDKQVKQLKQVWGNRRAGPRQETVIGSHRPRDGHGKTLSGRAVARGTRAERVAPLATAGRREPRPSDPLLARLSDELGELQRQRPLRRSQTGVEIARLHEGTVLYARNQERLFNPASNTKLFASAAALARLGSDYRFPTVILGPAVDGDRIGGSICLRGSGDPTLSASDLHHLASQLADIGVARIDGDLLVEQPSAERPTERTAERPAERSAKHSAERSIGRSPAGAADPGLAGLPATLGRLGVSLRGSRYVIRISPGARGARPQISVTPAFGIAATVNRAVSVDRRRSRVRLSLAAGKGGLVLTVGGRVSRRGGDLVLGRAPPDSTMFVGGLLRTVLSQHGIELQGEVRRGCAAAGLAPLATHWSPPLGVILRAVNKNSNNYTAEQVFAALGVEVAGSAGRAAAALSGFLASLGMAPGSYTLENGSGLSRANRVTPEQVVRLLRAAYLDFRLAPDFMASLSVAGIDGTLRGRFIGSGAERLLRGKTGTLSGVSALSGYLAHGGDTLVFSILVNGGFRWKRRNDVRRVQVAMVGAMLRYLRDRHPGAPPPVPLSIAARATTPPAVAMDTGSGTKTGTSSTAWPGAGAAAAAGEAAATDEESEAEETPAGTIQARPGASGGDTGKQRPGETMDEKHELAPPTR